jgi:hypothetical protein
VAFKPEYYSDMRSAVLIRSDQICNDACDILNRASLSFNFEFETLLLEVSSASAVYRNIGGHSGWHILGNFQNTGK